MEFELYKSLTSTQVNGIDAADVTLFEMTDTSSIVRVPVALTVTKPAGTAYTVADGARIEIKDEDDNIWFSFDADFLATAAVVSRYVPAVYGSATAGNKTLLISATGSIASGTSVLGLRIFHKQYPLTW
jgi:hypothetical protein